MDFSEYQKRLGKIKVEFSTDAPFKDFKKFSYKDYGISKPKNVKEQLEAIKLGKLHAEVHGLELDNTLKEKTLWLLFGFLGAETLAVFVLTFFQGFSPAGFHLEEWSFKLLLVSTIVQISYMLRMAVQHLFPNKDGKNKA